MEFCRHQSKSYRASLTILAATLISLMQPEAQGVAGPSATEGSGAKALGVVPAQVIATVQRRASRLVHLRTESSEIVTTPEHLFAKAGAGWVRADSLAAGDWLTRLTTPGSSVRLVSVTAEQVLSFPVFNLTVAGSHAYAVCADSVLVHNVNCNDEGGSSSGAKSQQARSDLEKKLAELEERRNREGPGTKGELDAEIAHLRKAIWTEEWAASHGARYLPDSSPSTLTDVQSSESEIDARIRWLEARRLQEGPGSQATLDDAIARLRKLRWDEERQRRQSRVRNMKEAMKLKLAEADREAEHFVRMAYDRFSHARDTKRAEEEVAAYEAEQAAIAAAARDADAAAIAEERGAAARAANAAWLERLNYGMRF